MLFFKRLVLVGGLLSMLLVGGLAQATAPTTSGYGGNSFLVQHIKVRGLKGVSLGTVLSYLPVSEGDRITSDETANIIRALYKTGFFNDVELKRRGSTLIISVIERAVVGKIAISGNKKISSKQLLDALKSAGFAEGRPYDKAVLAGIKESLIQQYNNYGHYNVVVKTNITKEPRNRVAVSIVVSEGAEAKIKKLSIVGNHAFKESELLDEFSLKESRWWRFYSSVDQYSKTKLEADLDSLRAFYMDHGYLRFNVDSTDVKMSDDKKHIYITVNVSEGKQYKIKGFDLKGNLIGKKPELLKLITIKAGDVFSRKEVMQDLASIHEFLGNFGYAYPDLGSDPVLDDKNATLFLHFKINPGKRIYVRRISFKGNVKTNEDVLRRELRQQEGALFSNEKLTESQRKLRNLGYLKGVQAKLVRVPNHPDKVDVEYNVKEVSSAMMNFQVGYSDVDKFVYGANIHETDFLGTGKRVGLQFQNSASQQQYSVSYFNPYHTIDNVSLGIDVYFHRTTPESIKLSSYTSDTYGGSVNYGFPLSDRNRLHFGYGFDHLKLNTSDNSPDEIKDFIIEHGNLLDTVKINAGWSYNNLDRAIFPTSGFANFLSLEAGLPGFKNSVEYYKAEYDAAYYYPLSKEFGLHLRANLGYGDGYGSYDTLPFFKHFYCGGMNSVRGFSGDTLGPRDSKGAPLGGNVVGSASFGVIFPNPLGESVRTTAFIDAGSAYQDRFSFADLRSSVGVAIEWRSPLGILNFALSEPINSHSTDDTNFFDFTIGTSF